MSNHKEKETLILLGYRKNPKMTVLYILEGDFNLADEYPLNGHWENFLMSVPVLPHHRVTEWYKEAKLSGAYRGESFDGLRYYHVRFFWSKK